MVVTVFLYVNSVRTYQFKAKHSEMKQYPLCLSSIPKEFTVVNLKKTELNQCTYCSLLIIILMVVVLLKIFANI